MIGKITSLRETDYFDAKVKIISISKTRAKVKFLHDCCDCDVVYCCCDHWIHYQEGDIKSFPHNNVTALFIQNAKEKARKKTANRITGLAMRLKGALLKNKWYENPTLIDKEVREVLSRIEL